MKKQFLFLFITLAFGVQAAEIHDGLWFAEHSRASAGFTETPAQIKGPFYPVKIPQNTNSDLTVVQGKEALGKKVYIHGKIMDTNGKPLSNARVEIWQACQAGSYNHPRDTNPAPRDPNFEYYAAVVTEADGNYQFKTIVPGPYPADTDWMRPSHIHYRVSYQRHTPFITQLYFDGNSFLNELISTVRGKKITGAVMNKLNELDLLFKELPEPGHSQLLVSFNTVEHFDAPVGVFNIYLNLGDSSEL